MRLHDDMNTTEFSCTMYIRTTPEKLWAALPEPTLSRQYWIDGFASTWKTGARWERRGGDDNSRVTICGEILDSTPPRRLVMTWAEPDGSGDTETHSRVSFEITPIGDMVRLHLHHDRLIAGSIIANKIVVGWPRVLSSLKSLLETGIALDTWTDYQAPDILAPKSVG